MSEVGEDIFTKPVQQKSGLNTSIRRDDAAVFVANRPSIDSRKFPFDTGTDKSLGLKSWTATKADRMSAVEAGQKFRDILRMFKIERQDPEFCMAFFESLMYSLAVNSSSVLTPDRAIITVATATFKLYDVIVFLSSDLRRFYRAYADDTVKILKLILNHPDQFDDDIRDKKDLIRSVARDRGLTRHPYLIGDNAEACTGLTDVEHVAIANSKQSKLEGVINVADRLKTSANPKTIGTYDSTNSEFLDKP